MLKLSQENQIIDLPDLNRFRIGDEVIVDASAENDRFEGLIIGIELTRRYSFGPLEPSITLLHDGYVTDGFKPIDCRKVDLTSPAPNLEGPSAGQKRPSSEGNLNKGEDDTHADKDFQKDVAHRAEITSPAAPANLSRSKQSVEKAFSLNHRNELSAGHGSGLSDSDLAHEGDEPSKSVDLNSDVSGDDHHDAPVWHGEGNTAASNDPLPNLAVDRCDPMPWSPIAEADSGIAYFLHAGDMQIGNSYPSWCRDTDGRVFEAVWTDNGKKAYWWDIEGESPVDPVEFMPHPLAALKATGGAPE